MGVGEASRLMCHGGFTCAEADEGAQHMAASITRLRAERNAALRAYDAEVIGRREEVTRLLEELGRARAEVARLRVGGGG
jgi:hypothetical protein